MEPLRHIIRHKKASVKFYEAEATKIDHDRRVVVINDLSDVKGDVHQTEVPFDYLVVGVGAENATFGECNLQHVNIIGIGTESRDFAGI